MNDYERDLTIDKMALDEELLRQPMICFKYSGKIAQAIDERDRAKQNLDVVDSEIDAKIRTNPEHYGLAEKVTEKSIRSVLLLDEAYQTALEEVNKANYNYNILTGVKESVSQKKSSLDNLVRLYSDDYYATRTSASVPKGASESVGKRVTKEQNEVLAGNVRLNQILKERR